MREEDNEIFEKLTGGIITDNSHFLRVLSQYNTCTLSSFHFIIFPEVSKISATKSGEQL